jgi:hypothetical protein
VSFATLGLAKLSPGARIWLGNGIPGMCEIEIDASTAWIAGLSDILFIKNGARLAGISRRAVPTVAMISVACIRGDHRPLS